jgi:phosphate:Na+ symporter
MLAEIITISGTLLGGLGLFILAIGMMTDGLKMAAGSSLRTILSEWSNTPLRGIISGFTMTAIVQSSSAVTVASIGFVNAGLLNMRQALGIVYGSNVGTTMTAWLVAVVGFKLNIQAFALPLIGIGMFVKLAQPEGRAASFGLALVGFGLFFVGIDVLKTAFEGLVAAFDISQFTADGVRGVVVYLMIGIVMTILTQSSSASIALTITAASSGVIGVFAAAAMVIGANIGTTSTAAIAAIGATSNAKRVAAAQIIFNLGTGLVALAILPILFLIITFFGKAMGLETIPSITLALFHSVFNLLGVLLIFPLNDRLATFLDQRFLTWEEKESHPRFLDKTIAATPDLAINALLLEVTSIATKLQSLCTQAIHPHNVARAAFHHNANVIKTLSAEVSKFIVSIESASLSEDTTNDLATLMRIEQYFLNCTQSTERFYLLLRRREKFHVPELEKASGIFFNKILDFVNDDWRHTQVSASRIEQTVGELQAEHDRLKASLLLEGTQARIPINQMSDEIDCIGEMMRMVKQWLKAIKRMKELQDQLGIVTVTPLENK